MTNTISPKLFNSFKAGNEDAAAEIISIFSKHLLHFIMRTVRSRAVAEEITQDAFLNLWLKREDLKSHTTLKTYLFNTAFYKSMDYVKGVIREREYLNDESYVGEFMTEMHSDMEFEELYLSIKTVVSKMPERRRKVFELCRDQGLSIDQIAEIMGISKKTVYNHLDLATQTLRDIFLSIVIILIIFF